MTDEDFNEEKKALLEDKSWEEEYNKLESKETKEYIMAAYVRLLMIYKDYGTITKEEFDYYSEFLLEKIR